MLEMTNSTTHFIYNLSWSTHSRSKNKHRHHFTLNRASKLHIKFSFELTIYIKSLAGIITMKNKATHLMKHEALAMKKNTDPLGISINRWIRDFNLLHVAHIASVSEFTTNGKVVKVVCTFIFCGKLPQ